jgi:hypothetical protein
MKGFSIFSASELGHHGLPMYLCAESPRPMPMIIRPSEMS